MKYCLQQKHQSHRGDLPVPFSPFGIRFFTESCPIYILKLRILLKHFYRFSQIFQICGKINIHISHNIAVIQLDSLPECYANASLPYSDIGHFRISFFQFLSNLRCFIFRSIIQYGKPAGDFHMFPDIGYRCLNPFPQPQSFIQDREKQINAVYFSFHRIFLISLQFSRYQKPDISGAYKSDSAVLTDTSE